MNKIILKLKDKILLKKLNFLTRIYSSLPISRLDHKPIPNWSDVSEDVMAKLPVFNQRHIPACVAHATVSTMQVEWYRRTGKMINFSPRFLDILSWTEDLNLNDGRNPELVMDLSVKIGCCTEDLLPNDTTLPVEQYRDRSLITKAMFEEASKYRMANLGLSFVKLF